MATTVPVITTSTPPAKKEENPSFCVSYLGAKNFYQEPLSDFLLPLLGQKCLFSINHQKGKWDHHLAWTCVGELTMTSTEAEPSFLKKYYMPPRYRADKNRAPQTEVRNGRRPEPLRAPQSPVTELWRSFTHFENHWARFLRQLPTLILYSSLFLRLMALADGVSLKGETTQSIEVTLKIGPVREPRGFPQACYSLGNCMDCSVLYK